MLIAAYAIIMPYFGRVVPDARFDLAQRLALGWSDGFGVGRGLRQHE
jgi:hypothetical protein